MKKLIFLIILILCTINLCAQSVSYDYKLLSKQGCHVKYSAYRQEDKSYIIVEVKSDGGISFVNDPIMMLRASNNEVIKLQGVNVGKHKEGGVGIVVSGILISEDYSVSTAQFEISNEQIEMLKSGIIKVRLSTIPYLHEREFKSDKIGKKLYKAFGKLKAAEF